MGLSTKSAIRSLQGVRSIQLDASAHCQLACPSCPTASGATRAAMGAGHLDVRAFEALLDANPGLTDIELFTPSRRAALRCGRRPACTRIPIGSDFTSRNGMAFARWATPFHHCWGWLWRRKSGGRSGSLRPVAAGGKPEMFGFWK